jgi:glycosyltransferase involved in cell wall biosynthesis
MKLVMATANLTVKGGAERILLKIAQHYDAKIYVGEYAPEMTFPEFGELDVETINRGMLLKALPYGRAAQGLSYGIGFLNFKLQEDYDVLNAHIAPSHWIRRNNERVLWYCHTPLREVWDLYEQRMMLKRAWQKPIHALGATAIRRIDKAIVDDIEFIYANSENTRSRIMEFFGRKDVEVLGGGIDYELYNDEGDGRYFFYPSRFSPNKRQDYVIRAFEIFKKRTKKSYRLVLAGATSRDKAHRAYKEGIRKMAAKAGDVLIIDDPTDERMRDLFAECTAVMYAPINEDYGLVPLEGMASRKPVISVNEGEPRFTILDGKTGLLVNSEEEMADRMLYISEHKSVAKQMGKSGYDRVKKNYSWDMFFSRFDERVAKIAKMR